MTTAVTAACFKQIGEQFVKLYYETFDSKRENLLHLYGAGSMLTFEGEQFMGRDVVMTKLTRLHFSERTSTLGLDSIDPVQGDHQTQYNCEEVGLQFKTVRHVLTTVDCQPTVGNGVLVFVVGQLRTDNDPPHGFSETFLLQPADTTCQTYFILNDMFRLSIHN